MLPDREVYLKLKNLFQLGWLESAEKGHWNIDCLESVSLTCPIYLSECYRMKIGLEDVLLIRLVYR